MGRTFSALLLAVMLTACGQSSTAPSSTAERAAQGGYAATRSEEAPAPAAAEDVVAENRPQAPQQQAGVSAPAGQTLYLAYAYQIGLEIPAARLGAVMDAHTRACQQAGPRLCQLVGASRNGDPDSDMNGTLNIRGEPGWLRTFMGGVTAQAEAAGGRVLSQNTSTEDLTRAIVDTQAHLRAQTALRDRLQQLLQSRPGRLADLLEVERELARVQGEIDATQSNLAVMQTRVNMSELTIGYQSAPRPVSADTLDPLKHAFAGFLGLIVSGFAAIITIIGVLLPFAIVLGPVVWGILSWRKRQRERKAAAQAQSG